MAKPQQHGSSRARNGACVCRHDIHPIQCRGAKSFVDDLGLSRGVVLSRAAASLRFIETKPFDWEICPLRTDTSPHEGPLPREGICPQEAGSFPFLFVPTVQGRDTGLRIKVSVPPLFYLITSLGQIHLPTPWTGKDMSSLMISKV